MNRLTFTVLSLVSLVGCESQDTTAGTVLQIQRVAQGGVELTNPVDVLSGRDGNLYVLDAGAPAIHIVRATGEALTIGRLGAGPGEFRDPSGLFWFDAGSLGVVDAGNGRIQILDTTGTPLRVIPFPHGPAQVVWGGGDTLYAATYARQFALGAEGPRIEQTHLVSILSATDGRVLGEFGEPRVYEGKVIPIFGNMVSVARDGNTGRVWVSWPLEPIMQYFVPPSADPVTLVRELGFVPPSPIEYSIPQSPLPAGDAQIVTLSLDTDSKGNLVVLSAVERKVGRAGSETYRAPAQAIEVLSPTGDLLCRVRLPLVGTLIRSVQPGTVVLVSNDERAEIHRITFDCPGLTSASGGRGDATPSAKAAGESALARKDP